MPNQKYFIPIVSGSRTSVCVCVCVCVCVYATVLLELTIKLLCYVCMKENILYIRVNPIIVGYLQALYH